MLRSQRQGLGLNFRQKIVVVAMDFLFLVELAYSIYAGQQNPEYLTAIFLRNFIPLALITLIVARTLLKKLRAPEPVLLVHEPTEAAESRGNT